LITEPLNRFLGAVAAYLPNLIGPAILAALPLLFGASLVLVFAGHVALGLVIFGSGLFLGNLAAKTIESSRSAQAPLLGLAARVAILVLAGAMALRQMGLANEIITLAFGLLLGAIAVAIALAFGLGCREMAANAMKGWVAQLSDGTQESGTD